MYFHSRAEAGRMLASRLAKYRSENIVLIALGAGSSVVAAQIAIHLHCSMMLYMIKDIQLPGEIDVLAGLGSGDTFTYNNMYTAGQLEELTTEYHGLIDALRMEKSHELHKLLGTDGEIDKNRLRHRTVILVSDGLANGMSIDVSAQFLKTVSVQRLVIVTPIATVAAVDRMHLTGDEVVCLSVAENFFGVDHYYEDNYIPNIPGILKMMSNISIAWDR
ncbi:hypothetical protein CR970_01695 [Candidatus Saccharibacteria bacterium]|nr:MAG: hypothetical protein CR970_01695 [Candidatus Saccharibacteria bacterium]